MGVSAIARLLSNTTDGSSGCRRRARKDEVEDSKMGWHIRFSYQSKGTMRHSTKWHDGDPIIGALRVEHSCSCLSLGHESSEIGFSSKNTKAYMRTN
jgi:hypothetical protein